MVKKKYDSLLFCIDYRKVNTVPEDASALPNLHEALCDLGTAKVFIIVDFKSGYWQIPMEPKSHLYTAFSTPDENNYEFTVKQVIVV